MANRRASDQWVDPEVTVEVGDVIGLKGNVTVDSITSPWSDPNTYLGLATVDIGDENSVAIDGNVTIDSVASNTAWPDPNTYLGLATVDIGDENSVAIDGNVTIDSIDSNTAWSDPNTFIGLVSTASIHGKTDLATLIAGEDQTNDVMKTEQQFSYSYVAAAGVDNVIKASAGFLHAIIVGDAVASSIIEVSDHASDGDGNVQIYLADDALGPETYIVDAKFDTGICADITNQTHVTFIYR